MSGIEEIIQDLKNEIEYAERDRAMQNYNNEVNIRYYDGKLTGLRMAVGKLEMLLETLKERKQWK